MPETSTPWMTVVGEVDDVNLGSRDAETMPQVYQPVTQTIASEGVFASVAELSAADGWIVLRSRTALEQMENTLRATVQKIDPQLPLYQMQTMEYAISKSEAPRRFNTVQISSLAIAAVLLSVIGIYGLIAFSVALREQEIAVRMALGGHRSGVILLILSSGARLAAAGCGLGLLGAVAASRLLRSFLFEVSPIDPGVLALSAVAMLLLALAASALPARRASSTDLMPALPGEWKVPTIFGKPRAYALNAGRVAGKQEGTELLLVCRQTASRRLVCSQACPLVLGLRRLRLKTPSIAPC
jgi:hypothetical protein